MESVGMSSDEKPKPQTGSWRERVLWAFFAGAVPVFMWSYFPDNAHSLTESVLAAATVGGIFGILAAIFGQRVVDFVLDLRW